MASQEMGFELDFKGKVVMDSYGGGRRFNWEHELTQSPKCWENTVQSNSPSHLSARSRGLGDQAEKKKVAWGKVCSTLNSRRISSFFHFHVICTFLKHLLCARTVG